LWVQKFSINKKTEIMINVDDLTLGQIKEIQSLQNKEQQTPFIASDFVGKYVICRTRNEGINFGKVVRLDNTGVILEEARRIYYHKPKAKGVSWYEGVAFCGLSDDSKISNETTKVIIEDYSLTACTQEAIDNIKSKKSHEQN
jgi:hypothetical protein